MKVNRVILLVLDSVGIGSLPDSEKFGDIDVNTLGSIAKSTKNFKIPNLKKIGIGNIEGIDYIEKDKNQLWFLSYMFNLFANSNKPTKC